MNTIRLWFELPNFEDLLQNSNLDQEHKEAVRFFSENGYLVIDPEIEDLMRRLKKLFNLGLLLKKPNRRRNIK